MSGSSVPGTPVSQRFPPRVNPSQKADPLTGSYMSPTDPETQGANNIPTRLLLQLLLRFPPGLQAHRAPLYASLLRIDETIHLQMCREKATAARRIFIVNQSHCVKNVRLLHKGS